MSSVSEPAAAPSSSVFGEGHLKRDVGLRGLTLISLGSIIGSGWLLGALGAAQSAGPASLLSWVLAGAILATLALVHAELGSTYPVSGGTARFPFLSFGALGGFTGGWMAWIQAVTIAPIEVEAALAYLQANFPHSGLNNTNGTLTALGILVAAVCMGGFTFINIMGVRWLAESNGITMIWKLAVPTLTIIVLLIAAFHAKNFTAGGGFAPFGAKGIFSALPLGVVFALQGFEQAIQVGGEARNPQRDIHRAVIISMIIGTIIYILLEVAFIGAITPKNVSHNWLNPIPGIGHFGPYATLATTAGVGWLATILYIDAVVSPARHRPGVLGDLGPAVLRPRAQWLRTARPRAHRQARRAIRLADLLLRRRHAGVPAVPELVRPGQPRHLGNGDDVRDGARIARGPAAKRSGPSARLPVAGGEDPGAAVVRVRQLHRLLVGLEHDLLAVSVHHHRLRRVRGLPGDGDPEQETASGMARGGLDSAVADRARDHFLPGPVPVIRAEDRDGHSRSRCWLS